jgi:signal transduction histidine kinase
MKGSPNTDTHSLKLRVRLTALVAIVVSAVAGLTAWTCLGLAERALENRFEDELVALEVGAVNALADIDIRIETSLARLSRHLVEDDPDLLERLLETDPESRYDLVGVAEKLANLFSLPVLELLDEDGRILSSAHWPQNAGKTDEAAPRLPAGKTVWLEIEAADGTSIARVERAPLVVGERKIDLVGGRTLSLPVLRSLAGREAEATVVPAGAPAPSTGRSLGLEGPDGRGLGRVDLVLDRATLDRLLTRLRWTVLFVVLGGAAVGTAAGAWIARRATRPVEETLRALDSVAAGQADYDFPTATRDDLEALPEAFSRLHRSLDDQQRRRAAAERVAAWREVARRVAHEVKNPLAPIRLTVENLRKARRKSPEVFDELFDDGASAILEEVEQLQRLVTEFSEFARLPEPKRVGVDIDELIDSVLALYVGEPGITVDRRRGAGIPPVQGDPDLLARAFKNLVANAVEAMGPQGGALRVETALEDGAVVVRIVDAGPGFSVEAQRHLFEPYFTTKATGTGLGMTLAYRIVTEHGGLISAANRSEGGAEVVVRLEGIR